MDHSAALLLTPWLWLAFVLASIAAGYFNRLGSRIADSPWHDLFLRAMISITTLVARAALRRLDEGVRVLLVNELVDTLADEFAPAQRLSDRVTALARWLRDLTSLAVHRARVEDGVQSVDSSRIEQPLSLQTQRLCDLIFEEASAIRSSIESPDAAAAGANFEWHASAAGIDFSHVARVVATARMVASDVRDQRWMALCSSVEMAWHDLAAELRTAPSTRLDADALLLTTRLGLLADAARQKCQWLRSAKRDSGFTEAA